MNANQTIGRYEILDTIGCGSMGSVFKAVDPAFDRIVAIKTVRLDLPSRSPKYASFKSRFYQEARILGSLSHPNITALFDMGETPEGQPFMVMEYQTGDSLEDVLEGASGLELDRAIRTLEPIAAAVDYAHGKGVVHRDLKPSNILIDDDVVKITDFGIAKIVNMNFTTGATILGTPSYMAPEQVNSDSHGKHADIFSLGVIAFEMLSGELPFPGNNVNTILYKVLGAEPIQPRNLEHRGIDSGRWNDVFSKALHKDPEMRYESASAFVEALNELCLPAAVDAPSDTSHERATMTICRSALFPRAPKPRVRPPMLALLAFSVVFGAAVSAFQSGAEPDTVPEANVQTSQLPMLVHAPAEILGEISIESAPAGASVSLDGESRGITPLDVSDLPLGKHTVRIEKPGFEAVDFTTDLSVQHSRTMLNISLNEEAAPLASAAQGVPQSEVHTKSKLSVIPSADPVSIAASVQYLGDRIVIRNENDFDWRNVELTLPSFASVVRISRIRSTGSYSIAVSSLSRGVRGTPVEQIRVSISCDTPFGKGAASRVSTRSSGLASLDVGLSNDARN
jgi:serine/threonine protein kinase